MYKNSSTLIHKYRVFRTHFRQEYKKGQAEGDDQNREHHQNFNKSLQDLKKHNDVDSNLIKALK